MSHTGSDIAAFLDGERRFVAAAWRDDPDRPYMVLANGEAAQHRELARTHLRCMFHDCPAPAITTVSRPGRRDGYRHLSTDATGHGGPEGFHHISGKAVLVDHLRTTYPYLLVYAEQGIDTQRTRVADVLVEDPQSGKRIAFEVQYAALTVELWRQRNADYAAAGIPVVWLFGHTGAQLNVRAGRIRLTPVQQAAVTDGRAILWLSPTLGQIAVATTTGHKIGTTLVLPETPPRTWQGDVELAIAPLKDVTLTDDDVTWPHLAALRAATVGAFQRREQQRLIDEEWERTRKARERVDAEARAERAAKESVTKQAIKSAADEARTARRAEAARQRELRPATTARTPGRTPILLCNVCREPLDQLLATLGRHLMPCDPQR